MKIFIAGLATETNTFAPLPAGRAAFRADFARRDGTRNPPSLSNIGLKAWRAMAEADGHAVVESLSTFAQPGGITLRAVYEELRDALIEHDLDGLLREIELDRANGLLGKTCIHPSHVLPVHALSVVSHEEFSDAQDILRPERGGSIQSRTESLDVGVRNRTAERPLQRSALGRLIEALHASRADPGATARLQPAHGQTSVRSECDPIELPGRRLAATPDAAALGLFLN